MGLILFDDHSWENLLPLTYTKPVAELRIGILTIREKWEKYTGKRASFITRDYLQNKFPTKPGTDNLLINGSVLPDSALLKAIKALNENQFIRKGETVIAGRVAVLPETFSLAALWGKGSEYSGDISIVDYPWKIFSLNGQEIISDFELVTRNRASCKLSKTVNTIQPGDIFVEEGFRGEFITINATNGPVYLGPDSEIMEGSVIRGPFSLGRESVVKLAAKIYGPTTIGPYSKAGGEINNSVIQGYSNKGHDGFLGNSVIGEWCNIGADTNNSNLKNNYANVKLWSYPNNRFMDTGLQFCGLIMGDHSKCGINTMFNTGTVVGVSANIFGSGFLRNFIPSFSWGGAAGMTTYSIEKAFETMKLVLERRNLELTAEDRQILHHIFETTEKYRARI